MKDREVGGYGSPPARGRQSRMRGRHRRGSRPSVPLVGQHRQRMEFDSFLVQLLGVLERSLAVDRAVIDLAIVHLAGFLGEFLADVIGILGEVLAQLLELLAQLVLLWRYH